MGLNYLSDGLPLWSRLGARFGTWFVINLKIFFTEGMTSRRVKYIGQGLRRPSKIFKLLPLSEITTKILAIQFHKSYSIRPLLMHFNAIVVSWVNEVLKYQNRFREISFWSCWAISETLFSLFKEMHTCIQAIFWTNRM